MGRLGLVNLADKSDTELLVLFGRILDESLLGDGFTSLQLQELRQINEEVKRREARKERL